MLKTLSQQVPIKGRWLNLGLAGTGLACLNPWDSVASSVLADIAAKAAWPHYYPEALSLTKGSLWLSTAMLAPYAMSKLFYPLDRDGQLPVKQPLKQVQLGDMVFNESDLFTNIMITGAIGSGKTSSAIYPILSQLLSIYSVEDEATSPNAKDYGYLKMGGLVMDVKGDFYEALLYKLDKAGRNVLEDVVIITPLAEYPFIELVDVDTGNYFYIAARGGGEESSNELFRLLKGVPGPNAMGEPDPRQPIPISVLLSERELNTKLGSGKTMREFLMEHPFDVEKRSMNFLGWRRDGSQLRRVTHTSGYHKVEYAKDANGDAIYTSPPKRLRYNRTRWVNNGLTFNICPPSLTPIELANRLVAMGRNASGKQGGGDNPFWDDATKKHIGWVVQLWREVVPEREVTAIDINRMTVDNDFVDDKVKLLKKLIDKKVRDKALVDSPNDKNRLERELEILSDMRVYFESEWAGLDDKTKSNLKSTITNVFGQFMSDALLRSVFCVPSTVKLEEMMQSGKLFTLVAPGYESAARVFGTSLKMEFQKLLKDRVSIPHFNKVRFILFMCDEAQNFVTAGGSDPTTGDENFMALSRQSRVCNIIATQSDSSIINVIGEKSSPVYYQQFGSRIWYQNTDEKTNKSASQILGKIKKEKTSRSGHEFHTATIFSKDSQARGFSESISIEEKERFPAELFPNLNIHECVIYNKAKQGQKDKSCRNKVSPDPIGKEEKDAKNATVRWYFQAYIENQLHKIGESFLLDHVKQEKPKAAAEEVVFDPESTLGATPPAASKPTAETVAAPKGVFEEFLQETSNTPETEAKAATESELPGLNVFSFTEKPQPPPDLFGLTSIEGEFQPTPKEEAKTETAQPTASGSDETETNLDYDPFFAKSYQPELTEAELAEIRAKFGDTAQIQERFNSCVTIIESIQRQAADFEAPLHELKASETFNGSDIVGTDEKAFFNPADTDGLISRTKVATEPAPKVEVKVEKKPVSAPVVTDDDFDLDGLKVSGEVEQPTASEDDDLEELFASARTKK